jgi:hypothetical protein
MDNFILFNILIISQWFTINNFIDWHMKRTPIDI